MFQGGFVGQECQVLGSRADSEWTELTSFYPANDNSKQSFPISCDAAWSNYRIVFKSFTDFYGRIVVYTVTFE